MEILENAAAWSTEFAQGWLAHLEQTGKIEWKKYHYARNRTEITGPGVDPRQAKLLVVSTAGGYLRASQEPFDAPNDLGDYSLRLFPVDTPLDDLDYAHEHYEHDARKQDPRVNLPLDYLKDLVTNGEFGSLAESVVSFSGYMPDVGQVLETLVPAIVAEAKQQNATAALLVPV